MKTAITGGVAEGKSTVLGILAEAGAKTLSLDEVARNIFADFEVNRLLAQAAGKMAPIEASELRSAILGDSSLRRAVNRIMHPRISQVVQLTDAEFIEVPLLIEVCMQGHFDRVWVVTCGASEQRTRLIARYGDACDPDLMLSAQLSTDVKIAFADEVVRTNRPLETVRRDISEALSRRFD